MLVDAVAHREHHGVARNHRGGPGADRGDAIALSLEPRLLHLEADYAAALGDHAPRGGEEAEAQPGVRTRRRLAPRGDRRDQLVGVLSRRDEAGADPLQLLAVERVVESVLHVLELAVVVGLLERAAPGDRDHLVHVAEVGAVVRDVHHDVADSHDGHPPSDGVGLLAEGGQAVVVIDEVLRVVDAGQALALDAEVLGALRADGEDEGVEAHAGQVLHAQVGVPRHRDVTEIGHAGIAQDLLELAAQAALHLVLVQEDPVLGEPARLDVPVEQDHPTALGRERAGGEEARRPGPDHGHHVHWLVRHFRFETIAHGPVSGRREIP